MKCIYIILLVFFSGLTYAESLSLLGQWQGDYRTYIYHKDGIQKGFATMTLTVKEQNKEFLFATNVWQLHKTNSAQPDVAGKVVKSGKEVLLGLFAFNGKDITFIETEDNGVFQMSVISDDTIEATYYENQHHEATLFRVQLKRVK